MGGNAFKNLLPDASFPRMHPSVYNALKSCLLPILQTLYTHVVVAPEAPGKVDYGDLDFVVSGPRDGLTTDDVKLALRATCSVPMEGNRTSNYAIPAEAFEEVVRASGATSAGADADAATLTRGDAAGSFFQVDVNVCADKAQLERTVFYSSFGDLGYIFGLFAQTAGLSFNIFGLKLAEPVPTQPARTFYLSESMPDILAFFGLSMDRWREGFETQEDIFKWVAASPFVRPLVSRYRSANYKPSNKDRVDARPMRQNFVAFLQTHDIDSEGAAAASLFAQPGSREEKIEAALRFFGKYEEHAALLYKSRVQNRAREILNGTNVQLWTGVQGMPVRFVMDEVKKRLSSMPAVGSAPAMAMDEVQVWQRVLLEMSDDEVRALVVNVKEELQEKGELEFDWRAAKAAKLERKRQKELELKGGGHESESREQVAAVAAA